MKTNYLKNNENIIDNLIMIAAIGQNNELGKDNNLIWTLKEDLKFFRAQTIGKNIVMGYNTYISLPKILPGRNHIILTHRNMELANQIEICHSKEELLEKISNIKDDVYIIGGSSIYGQFINNANQMLLTEIEATCPEADAYFPSFDKDNWTGYLIDRHTENNINYKHMKYIRKR